MVDAIALAIQARCPVLLWGAPGIGKTATVAAVAGVLGLPLEVVIASIREPSDFAGLPVLDAGEVRFAPPAWAKRLAQAGRGILFLDEINTAPPAVQAALLRVVLDRVVGDQPLPREVAVVAAANPPEQAAGGWELGASLANRFLHLPFQVQAKEWAAGMVAGWPKPAVPRLPDDWEKRIPASRALVAAFIQARPALLLRPPDGPVSGPENCAWPSPRSWDMAARVLAAATATGVADDILLSLLAGCVGEGPVIEFLAWRRELDLPDPEALLADPAGFSLPGRGDQAAAVLSAVVAAAIGGLTPGRWKAAWQILARAADQGGSDVAAAAARVLAAAKPAGFSAPLEARKFFPILREAGLL